MENLQGETNSRAGFRLFACSQMSVSSIRPLFIVAEKMDGQKKC